MSTLDELLQQIEDPSELGWKDETYDLGRARSLSGADRSAYVTKLIENIQEGDTRAILTLGHLDAKEALPALQDAAKTAAPWASVARRALVLLGKGDDEIDVIANDALHAPGKMARVAAVMDLTKLGGPKAIESLLQALTDSEYEVRLLAWDGLVEILKLDSIVRAPVGQRGKGSVMELLKDFLGSSVAAFVKMGSDEMRALIRQFMAGESPASLDIRWKPNPAPQLTAQMNQAVVNPDATFPIAEIAKLTGLPRRRAEASLALGLEEGDVRVPDALVQLDATWTLPVLEELANSTKLSSEMREKIKAAVRGLKAS
jgi:HEAT repeat protein